MKSQNKSSNNKPATSPVSIGNYEILSGKSGKWCLHDRYSKIDMVTFTSSERKIFAITAKNRTDKNFYIKSVKLNGENWNHSYIKHSDLMGGGSLEFIMSDKPNMKWANEVIK